MNAKFVFVSASIKLVAWFAAPNARSVFVSASTASFPTVVSEIARSVFVSASTASLPLTEDVNPKAVFARIGLTTSAAIDVLVAIEVDAAPDNTLAASTEDVTAIEAAISTVRIAFAAALLEDVTVVDAAPVTTDDTVAETLLVVVMLDEADAVTMVPEAASRAASGALANGLKPSIVSL